MSNIEMRLRAASCESLQLHRGNQQIGDADAGRSRRPGTGCAARQWLVNDLQRRRKPGERDAGGTLNVVILAEDLIGVPIEHPDRIGALPVLEVNAAARKDLLNRLDEFLGQRVQLLVARTGRDTVDQRGAARWS
jgi:hypothetical protein